MLVKGDGLDHCTPKAFTHFWQWQAGGWEKSFMYKGIWVVGFCNIIVGGAHDYLRFA